MQGNSVRQFGTPWTFFLLSEQAMRQVKIYIIVMYVLTHIELSIICVEQQFFPAYRTIVVLTIESEDSENYRLIIGCEP